MITNDRKLRLLAAVPLFAECTGKELELLGRLTEVVEVAEGTVLIQEGRRGQEFFVVEEGAAVVERDGAEVEVIRPGGFFGELALIDGRPRNATVRAQTRLRVLLLGQREFTGLLSSSPMLARQILAELVRRLRVVEDRQAAERGAPVSA